MSHASRSTEESNSKSVVPNVSDGCVECKTREAGESPPQQREKLGRPVLAAMLMRRADYLYVRGRWLRVAVRAGLGSCPAAILFLVGLET